jgi:hypothetical protein
MVILAKLLASNRDDCDYTTYVFKNLEDNVTPQTRYVMCVKYPNWNSIRLKIGDEGYLHYEEIHAGIDKWYDGNGMVAYRYDTIQFIKFIPKAKEESYEYIM